MIAGAGVLSFTGTFVFGLLTKSPPASQQDDSKQPAGAEQQTEPNLPQPELYTLADVGADESTTKRGMTEKQLKNLIFEVREKIGDYDHKLQQLQLREQRLQMARESLRKEIEQLNSLRTELASVVAALKNERDMLLKSRLEISKTERANLMTIAATYDKMDSTGASKLIVSMCKSQTKSGSTAGAATMEDAVKILHYMTERTKGKLLSELVSSEPQLAAALCRRLKQITEQK